MSGWRVVIVIVAAFTLAFFTDGSYIASLLVSGFIIAAHEPGTREGYKDGYRQGTIDLALKATKPRDEP